MQESVEVRSRGLTLRGTLHVPDVKAAPDVKDKKLPLIIIFHGFGGNKTGPHFLFVKFSRVLADLGFASIRFDFAGSGESDGEFVNMTLSGELEDATNILNYVKKLEYVDQDRIGVVGFSMGGAVASILAGLNSKTVRSLCLWAPAGNMRELVKKDFIGDAYEDFLKNGIHEFEGMPIGKSLVEDLDKLDIYEAASGYDKSILLIHGDEDEVVALSASHKYLEYYGQKAKLVVINGADHLFSRQVWKKEVISYSIDFFRKELMGSVELEPC